MSADSLITPPNSLSTCYSLSTSADAYGMQAASPAIDTADETPIQLPAYFVPGCFTGKGIDETLYSY